MNLLSSPLGPLGPAGIAGEMLGSALKPKTSRKQQEPGGSKTTFNISPSASSMAGPLGSVGKLLGAGGGGGEAAAGGLGEVAGLAAAL
jgi:hypothetical protein